MENQKELLGQWKKSVKELIEISNIRVLIKEPCVYIENYIDELDLDEIKQFNIIIKLIRSNYWRFGHYIKLDFYKRPNGEIYALSFLTNDKRYDTKFIAMQFIDYECKIKNEIEFFKYILKNKYVPLQVICDNKVNNNRGVNPYKVGDKIYTWYRGNKDKEFTLERIQFHNHYKDNYVFSNGEEKEKYVFLNKKRNRDACRRLLGWVNMSDFFKEVLYTPLKKEMKTRDEKWNDHVGWRYYEWFYRLVCSYLDLNNGSGIDNPFKLDLSIVKNKRGNVDVKISIVSNEENDKYGWYKFMAYRNIDVNQPAVKEAIEKLGYNEGILEYCINGDPNDYQPEINYPQWIWNKKYKTW